MINVVDGLRNFILVTITFSLLLFTNIIDNSYHVSNFIKLSLGVYAYRICTIHSHKHFRHATYAYYKKQHFSRIY